MRHSNATSNSRSYAAPYPTSLNPSDTPNTIANTGEDGLSWVTRLPSIGR